MIVPELWFEIGHSLSARRRRHSANGTIMTWAHFEWLAAFYMILLCFHRRTDRSVGLRRRIVVIVLRRLDGNYLEKWSNRRIMKCSLRQITWWCFDVFEPFQPFAVRGRLHQQKSRKSESNSEKPGNNNEKIFLETTWWTQYSNFQ